LEDLWVQQERMTAQKLGVETELNRTDGLPRAQGFVAGARDDAAAIGYEGQPIITGWSTSCPSATQRRY
jgi:hypothetical protein